MGALLKKKKIYILFFFLNKREGDASVFLMGCQLTMLRRKFLNATSIHEFIHAHTGLDVICCSSSLHAKTLDTTMEWPSWLVYVLLL